MESSNRTETRQWRAGGFAAFYLAFAYIAAMPYFLVVVDYLGATTMAEKVALILGNYRSMYAMYFPTYILFGIALSVVAFSLYDRMKAHSPAMMRTVTTIGLLWSFALAASGMVYTYGMTTIVGIAKTDLAQAQAAWQAIEPVAMGLGGAGGEILGGLWVLLACLVALRSGMLPKPLSWLGIVTGVAGLASVIPPLKDASMVFGILQILWLLWLGVVLLSGKKAGSTCFSSGAILSL